MIALFDFIYSFICQIPTSFFTTFLSRTTTPHLPPKFNPIVFVLFHHCLHILNK